MKRVLWASCAALMASSLAAAPDADAQEIRRLRVGNAPQAEIVVVADHEGNISKYWIGVMATPVDDVLKSQLRLESGLAVSEVVKDGPAAKAGMKANDILLKFNGKSLDSVEALLAAVGKTEGKAAELIVLRAGSEKKIKVSPAERPKGQWKDLTMRIVPKALQGALGGNHPDKLLFFGPGMQVRPGQNVDIEALLKQAHKYADAAGASGGDQKHENISIAIEKSGDGPAKITVKKNGKTYEVDENKLDSLPEDIRDIVKKHLAGKSEAKAKWRVGPGQFEWPRPRVHLDIPGLQRHDQHIEKQMQQMMQRMEKILKEIDELKKDRKERSKRSDRGESVDA